VRRRAALALCAAAALAAPPAHAYFEETVVGARGAALGPASLGLIGDASSYYWNPAGLGELRRPEVLLDYAKPYALPDLNVGAVVLAAPRFGAGWALAWHRLGIADAYAEDQVCLAAGRRLALTRGGHEVLGGATFKYERVSFQPFADPLAGGTVDFGAQGKGSLDAGLRWRTPWRVDLSWVGRDLLQPRFQFVSESGGDLQKARQEVAAAFRWNRESTITFGWSQADAGVTSFNAGIEIQFFDVFAIRSGVNNMSTIYQAYGSPDEMQYTGGFGIFQRGWYVDAAAATDRNLGASYRVTMRVPFGGAGRP
jgi:hypothetical protein